MGSTGYEDELNEHGLQTDGDRLRHSSLSAANRGRARSDVSGDATSSGTPMVPRTLQGRRFSKLDTSLHPQNKIKLEQNVVEVKTEAFIRAFLYPSSPLDEHDPVMKRDLLLAVDCHKLLQERCSDNEVLMPILADTGCPKYSEGAFTLLDATREENLYTPFRKLLTFINTFHRVSLGNQPMPFDIDAAWPAAVDPKPGAPANTTEFTGSLRRDFFDTSDVKAKFSPRFGRQTPNVKPDLVLMLHHKKDPNKKQTSVYWKDVKVPIELKRNFNSERDIILQVSIYTRAILMEQFDRKFVITVSLSATQCRLFHWDSVGCHATEKIDIHHNPILFIRCIARLAMMTPAELGYDEHFSNAGRALSDEKITTTLTIRESPIQQDLDRAPGSVAMLPNAVNSRLLELDTEHVLCGSNGELFHRYTRVWSGKEILDAMTWETGPSRVVKQTWAKDTRPCEGYFYTLTKKIPAVSSLLIMEECDRTWAYHNRVADRDVIGYLKTTGSKPDRQPRAEEVEQPGGDLSTFSPDPEYKPNPLEQSAHSTLNTSSIPAGSVERVLLRFLFEEEYQPLSKAENSRQVMNATVEWIEGLIELDRQGIVHGNISFNNLMLPAIQPKSGPSKVAKVIDLSLAHWKETQGGDEPTSGSPCVSPGVLEALLNNQRSIPEDLSTTGARTPRAHHHITGTLPFIALDLIDQLEDASDTEFIEHALRHDVESVFWVLVYLCHVQAGPLGTKRMLASLGGLTSNDIHGVSCQKFVILHDHKHLPTIRGKFSKLRGFLEAFASYYRACYRAHQSIDVFTVRDIAIEHRDKLAEDERKNPTPASVQRPALMTAPGPTATVDSPKRKLGVHEDSSSNGEGAMEELEDDGSNPRKKTKLP
ncbi:hypothetical protein FRC01_003786 [Tulasnella sp. 417]|nr:hypothetical protein FRC01_003786 [Tulasnella sp. 417]